MQDDNSVEQRTSEVKRTFKVDPHKYVIAHANNQVYTARKIPVGITKREFRLGVRQWRKERILKLRAKSTSDVTGE